MYIVRPGKNRATKRQSLDLQVHPILDMSIDKIERAQRRVAHGEARAERYAAKELRHEPGQGTAVKMHAVRGGAGARGGRTW